jgi:hypothetical protein
VADKYLCRVCSKEVAATKNLRYRTHYDSNNERCENASEEIPADLIEGGPIPGGSDPGVPREGMDFAVCPQCSRKVKLTRLGYFEPHDETLLGGDRCPVSGVRQKHARRQDDVLLPGDEPASPVPRVTAQQEITSPAPTSGSASADSSPKELPPTSGTTEIDWSDVTAAIPPVSTATPNATPSGGPIDWSKVGDLKHLPAPDAGSSVSTETSSPESPTTSTPSAGGGPSTSSDAPGESADAAPFSLGAPLSTAFLQPFSPFLQPGAWIPPTLVFLQPQAYEGPVKAEPMGDLAKELSTKIKETFYAYSNRKSTDNRSAQTTLGPSEIGTPCDRRLAMSLMGIPPVNAGGDGWAAFVGTCTHEGMASVYTFADAGTGRYAVELPVFTGMPTVPRGTTDLLDRRDGTVVDWKVMGKYSLDKFRKEGPSATYRTQAHVYGLGAERGGEKVRNVAIVGLPRAGSSLDEMHIWTEKYDRKFAQAALDRVEKIARDVEYELNGHRTGRITTKMEAAQQMPTGDDCRYCPFHLKNDKEMQRGCPGK